MGMEADEDDPFDAEHDDDVNDDSFLSAVGLADQQLRERGAASTELHTWIDSIADPWERSTSWAGAMTALAKLTADYRTSANAARNEWAAEHPGETLSTLLDEASQNADANAGFYQDLADQLGRGVPDPVQRAQIANVWAHSLSTWADLLRRARNDAVIEALHNGTPIGRLARQLGLTRQGVMKIRDGHAD